MQAKVKRASGRWCSVEHAVRQKQSRWHASRIQGPIDIASAARGKELNRVETSQNGIRQRRRSGDLNSTARLDAKVRAAVAVADCDRLVVRAQVISVAENAVQAVIAALTNDADAPIAIGDVHRIIAAVICVRRGLKIHAANRRTGK